MRFDMRRGEELHAVDVTDLGGGRHRVRWTRRAPSEDGRPGAVLGEGELDLEVSPGPAGYTVMAGHDVHVVRVERRGPARLVTIAGATLELEHVDPFRAAARSGGSGATGPRAVASPMPGRIVSIPVGVGEPIAEGATAIVVEAMKMANELRAPISGRVTAVRAKVGDTVEAGAELVVISPEPAAGG